MKRNLWYSIGLVPAALCVFGNLLGGWWTTSNFIYSLIILGLLDFVLGEDASNETEDSPLPELWLILHTVFHISALLTLFIGIQQGIIIDNFIIWAALSTGFQAGSSAVVVAHECIHKANPWYRNTGIWLLRSVGNVYFYVHHLRVHHRDVATSNDAVTAKKGEWIYTFIVRAIIQQHIQAWQQEKFRLRKATIWNKMISNIQIQNYVWLLIIGLGLYTLNPLFAGAWLLVLLMSAVLLEYVNYIEHYGLLRLNGEPVGVEHSWNTQRLVSRFLLLDLPRHSHHHIHANLSYHKLESLPKERILPGGYASLIFPVFLPFWWFSMIHPRLNSN